jgi:hypothetical protein
VAELIASLDSTPPPVASGVIATAGDAPASEPLMAAAGDERG